MESLDTDEALYEATETNSVPSMTKRMSDIQTMGTRVTSPVIRTTLKGLRTHEWAQGHPSGLWPKTTMATIGSGERKIKR